MKNSYKIHRYTGYIGIIVFFLLCFSGLAIMIRGFAGFTNDKVTYSSDISMWQNSKTQVESILQEHPNYTLRSMAIRPETSLISFRFTEKGNREIIRYHYYVQDGELTPMNSQMVPRHVDMDYTAVVVRWLARFHSNFLLGDPGRVLLLAFSIISLITCFTGYKMYKRMAANRTDKTSYSLHTLLGLVVVPYCIILFISGILLIGHSYFLRTYSDDSAVAAQNYFSTQAKSNSLFTYDEIFSLVEQKYPEKEIVSIDIPTARELKDSATATYHLRLVDKSTIRNMYQGYLVADDVWISAFKTGTPETFMTNSPWYMKILALGVDLHFKNHNHPLMEIIWMIYLLLSCVLMLLLFIKPVKRIRVYTKPNMHIGTVSFILTCCYLILPLFGNVGMYLGIICGFMSLILIGFSIKNIKYIAQ